jgi:hypothetical protein
MGKRIFLAATAAGLILAGAGCGESNSEACVIKECYRAVSCVEECGGPVIQSSCCSCPEGTVDEIDCASAGGGS